MNEQLEAVVRVMADTVLENEQYFSELDGVVGDGDFGFSLARGFEKVLEDWDQLDRDTPGGFLRGICSVITSAVGGVSGTIWGTAFLRAALYLGPKTQVEQADIVPMLRSSIEGIKKRGQADIGDKTLLDSLIPTVDQLEAAFGRGEASKAALGDAAAQARRSAEATRGMLAKRGRAAYTGERSIGTLDAGAVAVAVLMEAIHQSWAD
jgi:phosphoenolpyruvate---glycerone phosphotransferase subunit DhaL